MAAEAWAGRAPKRSHFSVFGGPPQCTDEGLKAIGLCRPALYRHQDCSYGGQQEYPGNGQVPQRLTLTPLEVTHAGCRILATPEPSEQQPEW